MEIYHSKKCTKHILAIISISIWYQVGMDTDQESPFQFRVREQDGHKTKS